MGGGQGHHQHQQQHARVGKTRSVSRFTVYTLNMNLFFFAANKVLISNEKCKFMLHTDLEAVVS